ncbi:hypothetical protein DYBT9275_05677 [Dyadobacter sp. CECT 9275]|uniref:Four-carbon acid sugar kinase family protein n=1 Tax=Dyadobacter helix TaxID=2822344 RepID=A0A916NE26_9BACT|nr:four-carbon acid sugar kinase family protein [Dyadobacter sp. CECT 9275]CAG5016986.1 hypothetical protein DYBT9275_05677 [Dyadobacter sp. CECT 9275]
MIAVIADDFTGAAEIGGVGIRHGFSVVIETKVDKNISADILIIATDTRSQTPEKAADVTQKITSELLALHPDFIYKKIDSILRGNVGAELTAQLITSGKQKAMLVPANPQLNRTIRDGIYYYNGIPLNEFSFTNGTSNARTSSRVLDLLGEAVRPFTSVVSIGDALPEKGLIIGNTSDTDDLDNWVRKIDSQTIPAGGSSFFDAILRAHPKQTANQKISPLRLGPKMMYICGSAFDNSRMLVQKARQAGHAVAYMPENLLTDDGPDHSLFARWKNEICDGLQKTGKVIVAIDKITGVQENVSCKIRQAVATAVQSVMNEAEIDELIIEGGATAYAVTQKLGYTRLYPVNELGPGSIRMKVRENANIFLTLKPGSYTWPDVIWPY